MNGYLKIAILSTILLFISFQNRKNLLQIRERKIVVKILNYTFGAGYIGIL